MLDEEKIARRKRANEIRLNAVRDKARKTEIRHSQIKKSLGGLDESVKKATHIQFADSDDDSENIDSSVHSNNESEQVAKSKADNILGFENEDSDDIQIAVKPQFQGKEGEKLLQLQSSYGNDARFRLDKRFAVEEDDSTSDDELKVTRFYSLNPDAEESRDVKSELARNMEVLNQVIGHDVSSKEQTKKKGERFIDVSSRRYDPTKDDHLEVKVEKKEETLKKKKKKKKEKIEIVETDSRKFFDTSTDALRSAFAAKPAENNDTLAKEQAEEPFSFLAMLGRPNEDKNESESQKKKKTENADDSRFSISSVMKKDMPTLKKEFRYDSSETEDEDEDEEVVDEIKDIAPELTESKVPQGSPPSHWPTTFFLTSQQDPRIAEGVKDFCWNKSFEQIQQEWLEVKDTLMKDYKKKHRDAKRKERKAKYEARLLAASTDT